MYNGPKVERKFEADYPHGYKADEAGNLIHDIDGRPLQIGGRTVGRRVVGGKDEAFPTTEFDALAEATTGRSVETFPGSRNYVGSLATGRYSGKPEQIYLSEKLTSEQSAKVFAHELGHAIDQLAGKIPVKGIRWDLDKLYNTLNNLDRLHSNPELPANWGKPWTPAAYGYKGDDIPRELMAEAIRLYMSNPSYLKDTAPAVAKAIRKAVNGNPELRKIIRFNSGGPPITPASTLSNFISAAVLVCLRDFTRRQSDGN